MSSSSSCHVVLPSLDAWIHAVAAHGGLVVFAGIPIGVLLYSVAVVSQQRHGGRASTSCSTDDGHHRPRQQPTTLAVTVVSLLVATSVLVFSIPLSKKKTTTGSWISRFLLSTFCFSTFFKTLSVALGTLPDELLLMNGDSTLSSSLQTWLVWFTCLPEPIILVKDEAKMLKKATWMDIQHRAYYLVLKIAGLSFLVSLLLHVQKQQQQGHHHNVVAVVEVVYYNSFLQRRLLGLARVWFLDCWLALCLDVSALFIMLVTGAKTHAGFCNPLLASRSMGECWSRRWNLPVARLLQRGIYKPVRLNLGWSRSASVLATFLASGLLHEYTFVVHNGHDHYQLGTASVFFALMGIVLLVEHAVLSWSAGGRVERAVQRVPSPIFATIVTTLAAIPFEALFLQSWLDAGALEAVSELVPHAKCL